jgi:hypothetical protein
MRNEQRATQLFYHDHVVGMTRLDVMAGVIGTAYFIRDPENEPLDAPDSPLPKGQYEIPLVFFNRSFFTDRELNFPRTGLNATNPYWTVFTGATLHGRQVRCVRSHPGSLPLPELGRREPMGCETTSLLAPTDRCQRTSAMSSSNVRCQCSRCWQVTLTRRTSLWAGA